ncbi:integrin beta-like protein 1 [Cricetulus griseus]|uniref:Integrin beta-like protein 1 n=1 Tax=Cricetulus griseus TaxID=10029 RepID=A0A061IJ74_CRIGR|nr:integrin beta-like protein 1 [Cricetulus griseus]
MLNAAPQLVASARVCTCRQSAIAIMQEFMACGFHYHTHKPGGIEKEDEDSSKGKINWRTTACHKILSLSGAPCRLSRAESERRCRAPGQPPGGALCHDRGRCECGVCICQVTEPGTYFGPLCECHEWVCENYDGKTCAGDSP